MIPSIRKLTSACPPPNLANHRPGRSRERRAAQKPDRRMVALWWPSSLFSRPFHFPRSTPAASSAGQVFCFLRPIFQIADYFPVDAKLALRSNCSVLNRFNSHHFAASSDQQRTRHEIVLRLGFETLPPRLLVLRFRRISRATILCPNDSR